MADPALEALLEVQAHDLAMDQLRHRRETLPEREALREVRAALADVERSTVSTAGRVNDLERGQRRLEDQIDLIEAKAAASESRLYGGQVQAPKELEALATEVKVLRSRKRSQEDELLEVMEAIEPLHGQIQVLHGQKETLAAEAERLSGVVADQEADIDRQHATELAARTELAGTVPDGLLATYEGLRRRLDGVGVARVDAGRCTGCHLSLPAVELDGLRRTAEGQVVRHEECGRILVP